MSEQPAPYRLLSTYGKVEHLVEETGGAYMDGFYKTLCGRFFDAFTVAIHKTEEPVLKTCWPCRLIQIRGGSLA